MASVSPTVGAMLIAEDLLLLLYDDEKGKPIAGSLGVDYALAGAVLVELTLHRKLGIGTDGTTAGRLQVLDDSPTGDPILDERLSYVVSKPGRGRRTRSVRCRSGCVISC